WPFAPEGRVSCFPASALLTAAVVAKPDTSGISSTSAFPLRADERSEVETRSDTSGISEESALDSSKASNPVTAPSSWVWLAAALASSADWSPVTSPTPIGPLGPSPPAYPHQGEAGGTLC